MFVRERVLYSIAWYCGGSLYEHHLRERKENTFLYFRRVSISFREVRVKKVVSMEKSPRSNLTDTFFFWTMRVGPLNVLLFIGIL